MNTHLKKNKIAFQKWLLGFCLIGLTACGAGGSGLSGGFVGTTETTESGVKYHFYKQNAQGKKAQNGDLLTFHLIIQNHQDSVLRNTYKEGKEGIKELPFEETYFIGKPYFKDIFKQVSEGDSLTFWIKVDSLANKSGFLKMPNTPLGTNMKYTVKVLKIRTKSEIKQAVEEQLRAQRELDNQLINSYLDSLAKQNKNLKILSTDSGIKYFFAQEGNGKLPLKGDTVSVNYIGRLLDGTIYGSSEATTEFLVGETLPPGLDEGFTKMKEGSKATFFLPSAIGFGEAGMGNLVPPNAVLIFEVEMVKVR